MSVKEKMTAIADAIRDKTGETSLLTLDDMATDIPKVYETGKVDEARAWWDCMTKDNTVTNYNNRFCRCNFNRVTGGFHPPYTLKPQYAVDMFTYCQGVTKITKEQIDFSNCLSYNYAFSNCSDLVEIEEIVLADNAYMFAECKKLETIGRIIINGVKHFSVNPPFVNCGALKNITFEGAILNAVSFRWSPLLTANSIESIVPALSVDATGQTITFNTAAKETYYNAHSSEYADADEAWDALCDTKPNWTISLV